MKYEVEVWGWREIGKMERMYEVFEVGVELNCLRNMLRMDLSKEEMVIRQRKRAAKVEKKFNKEKSAKMASVY